MSASQNQSIEVAAMLGDSVVGVKHCIDPKTGKVQTRTWVTLAIGAACVVAAIAAFAMSVHVAAANKAALDHWTRVLHKPSYAFRGETVSAALDWVAFGGFSFGLTALVLGLLRVRDERKSPYFRIGTAPGVELPLEAAPAAAFPLVAPSASGDDFVFNFAPGIEGDVVLDGRAAPFTELSARGMARPSLAVAGAFELSIPPGARIRARVGKATMLISAVERPRRAAVPLVAALERRTLAYFAGSLAVHVGLWALLQQFPEEGSAASIDLAMGEETTTRSAMSDHEDKVTPPDPTTDGGNSEAEGTDTKVALDTGESGTHTPGNDPKHLEIVNRGAENLQTAREDARRMAAADGILGTPMLQNTITSLASQNDWASGFSAYDQAGGVYDGSSEGGAGFGVGRGGFGAGGGCLHAPCGIGVGDYHFLGKGAHMGDGYGFGPGHGPGLPGHHPTVPQPRVGEPQMVGGYDKSIIRRYIKRNIEKISYCYEKQLVANPSLSGEVLVQFFIQPNGTVRGAVGSGFDSTVASCVADVVGQITFPAPTDGGGIQVNYPFTFHPAGH